MTYRLKQDADSICKARSLLMPEMADPGEAWELPDEQVIRYAEAMLNSFSGATAPLRTQLRSVSQAVGKTRRGRALGKLFGLYPYPPVDVYERLHEIAEQA